MKPKRSLEVQLMVDHAQLTSAEITRVLTIPGDVKWDAGESYKPSATSNEQKYQFSRWALREVAGSLNELPDAIRRIRERSQAIEKKFADLPIGTTVSLTLFITETDTVMAMGIDSAMIGFLARINAGLEMSLVVRTG